MLGALLAVSVLVHNQDAVSPQVLEKSMQIAEKAFRSAGIRMQWRTAQPDVFDADALHLALLPGMAGRRGFESTSPDAGHAILVQEGFATMARVFFGKVEELSFDYHARGYGTLAAIPLSATQPAILAVVVAHELAHLLLGRNSHKPGGLMDRSIQSESVLAAITGKLAFDAGQAADLRFEIMARQLHSGGFESLPLRTPGILECDLAGSSE